MVRSATSTRASRTSSTETPRRARAIGGFIRGAGLGGAATEKRGAIALLNPAPEHAKTWAAWQRTRSCARAGLRAVRLEPMRSGEWSLCFRSMRGRCSAHLFPEPPLTLRGAAEGEAPRNPPEQVSDAGVAGERVWRREGAGVSEPEVIRVLIVEDQRVLREGLALPDRRDAGTPARRGQGAGGRPEALSHSSSRAFANHRPRVTDRRSFDGILARGGARA
jgi:hypothetical protein